MHSIIDGKTLKQMIISAANNLSNNKQMIDDLNVFPVPDGDTGTNMSLTISLVKKELENIEGETCFEVISTAASASLRGARGNSGVILSQFFRGLAQGIGKKESLSVEDIKSAMIVSKETAYKAVMKPKEGTVLTVARVIAEFCESSIDENVSEFLNSAVEKGNKALEETTDMLPQLKQAGVVDAGGKGLMTALEGALYFLENDEIIHCENEVSFESKIEKNIDVENIKFGYCTEFIIKKNQKKSDWKSLRKKLEYIGDCVIVIDDPEIIKVHVHTNNPGIALEEALKSGALVDIKIDNLKEQAEEEKKKKKAKIANTPYKRDTFITVAAGDGLVQMFKELGVDAVIKGGQTMNPSTEDFVEEINKLNCQNVFILPNNKNIILAAKQTKELTDKNIIVIETKTVMQGISCMMAYEEDNELEENISLMNDAISSVASGSVTFAARDCKIDDLDIRKNDIMGLIEGNISTIGSNPKDVLKNIIEAMASDEKTSISIFRGENISEEEGESIQNELEELYPDFDINIYDGGQPLYYFFVSIE